MTSDEGFVRTVPKTSLRCNVELCLGLEGLGVLLGGWVVASGSGRPRMTLLGHGGEQLDVGTEAISTVRPDVVDFFRSTSTERVVIQDPSCGFLAFCRLNPAAPAKLTVSSEGEEIHVDLSPMRFDGTLPSDDLAYLRNPMRAVLELLRVHELTTEPAARALVAALGADAVELQQLFESSKSVVPLTVDTCVFGRGEGLALVGRVGAEPSEVASVSVLMSGTRERIEISKYTSYALSARGDSGPTSSSCRFVAVVPNSVLGPLPRKLVLTFQLKDKSEASLTTAVEMGCNALKSKMDTFDADVCLSLAEATATHWNGSPRGGELHQFISGVAQQMLAQLHFVFEVVEDSIAAAVDYVYYVPDRGVLVIGWLVDRDNRVCSFDACWDDGYYENVLQEAVHLSRPDVFESCRERMGSLPSDRVGFATFIELRGLTRARLEASLYFRLATRAGQLRRLRPTTIRGSRTNPISDIRDILSFIPVRDVNALRHVGPAVEGIWQRRSRVKGATRSIDVGEVHEAPDISVIVPIYGRYDFIEYQLSLFADDADLRTNELIFVIDDPRICDDAVRLCRERQPLFRVPCRIITCQRNNGYAAANNIGAAVARGRLLLLLNSDVMPKAPGWLSGLQRAHAALNNPGAIGPKLLYADGSLQHAGVAFEQRPGWPGLWINDHPGKGCRNLPQVNPAPVPVPAVTGACMLVERSLYESVGGLDEDYILGDFEDSDFCLALRRRGRQNWYIPSIELYHLERQSVSLLGAPDWRMALTLCNAWRHTNKWDDVIRDISAGARQ